MKRQTTTASIIFLAGIAYSQTPMAAPPPLSCEMQMMLNGLTALQRDQGVSRQANVLATNKDTDLTKREIKEILDRVYITQKIKTPDEIKDAVYRTCKNGR